MYSAAAHHAEQEVGVLEQQEDLQHMMQQQQPIDQAKSNIEDLLDYQQQPQPAMADLHQSQETIQPHQAQVMPQSDKTDSQKNVQGVDNASPKPLDTYKEANQGSGRTIKEE